LKALAILSKTRLGRKDLPWTNTPSLLGKMENYGIKSFITLAPCAETGILAQTEIGNLDQRCPKVIILKLFKNL
jgi:hypothetical protein